MKEIVGIAPHSFTTQPGYDLIKAAGIARDRPEHFGRGI
jgi:hypothetical protein